MKVSELVWSQSDISMMERSQVIYRVGIDSFRSFRACKHSDGKYSIVELGARYDFDTDGLCLLDLVCELENYELRPGAYKGAIQ